MKNNWKKDYLRYKDFFLNILQIYYTKPNIKIYLELILSLSTIIVFAIFAVKPTVLTIIELNKEIETKEETIVKINQKLLDLQKANQIIQDKEEGLQKIESAIPSLANAEDLISTMENLANKNSLQLINLSMSDITLIGKVAGKTKRIDATEKLPQGAEELPCSISMSGSYQNLLLFLFDIENLVRPLKVDSLVINSTKTENGKILILTVLGRMPFVKTEI